MANLGSFHPSFASAGFPDYAPAWVSALVLYSVQVEGHTARHRSGVQFRVYRPPRPHRLQLLYSSGTSTRSHRLQLSTVPSDPSSGAPASSLQLSTAVECSLGSIASSAAVHRVIGPEQWCARIVTTAQHRSGMQSRVYRIVLIGPGYSAVVQFKVYRPPRPHRLRAVHRVIGPEQWCARIVYSCPGMKKARTQVARIGSRSNGKVVVRPKNKPSRPSAQQVQNARSESSVTDSWCSPLVSGFLPKKHVGGPEGNTSAESAQTEPRMCLAQQRDEGRTTRRPSHHRRPVEPGAEGSRGPRRSRLRGRPILSSEFRRRGSRGPDCPGAEGPQGGRTRESQCDSLAASERGNRRPSDSIPSVTSQLQLSRARSSLAHNKLASTRARNSIQAGPIGKRHTGVPKRPRRVISTGVITRKPFKQLIKLVQPIAGGTGRDSLR